MKACHGVPDVLWSVSLEFFEPFFVIELNTEDRRKVG